MSGLGLLGGDTPFWEGMKSMVLLKNAAVESSPVLPLVPDKVATIAVIGRLAVAVTNTGNRDGRHVVQVHGRQRQGGYAGEHMLVGFAGVGVSAGASKPVEVAVSFTPLARWDAGKRRRVLPDPADVVLEVGSYAHDPAAVVVRLQP